MTTSHLLIQRRNMEKITGENPRFPERRYTRRAPVAKDSRFGRYQQRMT